MDGPAGTDFKADRCLQHLPYEACCLQKLLYKPAVISTIWFRFSDTQEPQGYETLYSSRSPRHIAKDSYPSPSRGVESDKLVGNILSAFYNSGVKNAYVMFVSVPVLN